MISDFYINKVYNITSSDGFFLIILFISSIVIIMTSYEYNMYLSVWSVQRPLYTIISNTHKGTVYIQYKRTGF